MRRALWVLVGLLVARPCAAEEPKRFIPIVGTEIGQTWERLSVTFDGMEQHEDRALWNTRIVAGLSASLPALGSFATRADTSVGFGVVYHTGHGHLDVREALLLDVPIAAGFSVPIGLGAGMVIDTASAARSAFEPSAVVGFRYRFVELWYRPSYSVPLGSEDRRVFTGSRELSARPGLSPVDLALRFHLTGLGF